VAFEKLLRANLSILWAYPEAFANAATPTAAELNNLFVYGSAEGGLVFDISCSILDDYTLNMTDSDTDDSISICDIGNVESPTFQNYEASLNHFRDSSVTANGVYNLAFDLFKGVDRPGYLIKRIGYPQGTPFAIGQNVSLYGFTTDYPVDVVDDNSMLQFGSRFKPNGNLNINYTIAA
jgi:hypothetical protein